MVRRRLTVKRLDPWSVLKFAVLANLVLFIVLLVLAMLVWFIVERLQLVEQACSIAIDVGFQRCVVDGSLVLRVSALLAGMAAVVNTGVLVFMAFLHNLIADLTGGLVLGVVEERAAGRPAPSTMSSREAVPGPGRESDGDARSTKRRDTAAPARDGVRGRPVSGSPGPVGIGEREELFGEQ